MDLSKLTSAFSSIIGENADEEGVKIWLDTGLPELNHAISGSYQGGLPCGRIIEIFGPESSGKTAIASAAMIAAQKAGGIAIFADHERSFLPRLSQQAGLDLTPGRFVYVRPRSFEESLDLVVNFCREVRKTKAIDDEAPIIAIFDSLAAMVPKSKLFIDEKKGTLKGANDQTMHDSLALAKATSTAFPAFSLYVEELNICAVFLNQEREKPGVSFGDPRTTPGGKAPKFYASVRISLGRNITKDASGDESGQVIKAKIIKNKVSRPFQTAAWHFVFRDDGTGFLDAIGSTIDHLKETGLIKLAGTRLEWEGKTYFRNQLAEKLRTENKQAELFDLLPKSVPGCYASEGSGKDLFEAEEPTEADQSPTE